MRFWTDALNKKLRCLAIISSLLILVEKKAHSVEDTGMQFLITDQPFVFFQNIHQCSGKGTSYIGIFPGQFHFTTGRQHHVCPKGQ